MCDQNWSLILKTSCITPWFQWILIFMTFLHLKSDSDDEEDHQIEEIHHKSRLDIPIDVDFSDSTLAYIDSDNYDMIMVMILVEGLLVMPPFSKKGGNQ